jgi:hypothetical protein
MDKKRERQRRAARLKIFGFERPNPADNEIRPRLTSADAFHGVPSSSISKIN